MLIAECRVLVQVKVSVLKVLQLFKLPLNIHGYVLKLVLE